MHPLFPEHPEADIGWIHVTRADPATGRKAWAARLWPARELVDIQQIWEVYGGGVYELVGRGADKSKITARYEFELEGPSKPLNQAPRAEAAPAPVHIPAPSSSSDAMIPLLMQMMQSQSQQTTQILLAVLQRGETSGREHVQSMTALHDRFAMGQTELMKALMQTGGGGGGGGGGFQSGVNFALRFLSENRDKLGEAVNETESGEDLLQTLSQVMAGVSMMAQANQGASPGGFVPGSVPHPNANGAAPEEEDDDEDDGQGLPPVPL